MNKVLTLLLSTFILISCKVKPTGELSDRIHRVPRVKQFLLGLDQDKSEFDFLQATISGKLFLDKSFPVKGTMRIKKDSVIWMSFRYFGQEVARVQLEPNRFRLINRFHKEYMDTDYASISTHLGVKVDYSFFQNLLLGDPLLEPNLDFYSFRDNSNYILSNTKRHVEQEKVNLFFNYIINKQSFKPIRQVYTIANGQTKLSADYIEYSLEDKISPKLQLEISGEKSMSVNWKFSKVITGKTLSFPFKVSSKYKRVDI